MTYANNPAYTLAAEQGIYKIYVPVNPADGYHTSRYVEALNQQIYSQAGANKELLESVMDDMIARCNKATNTDTLRTDIAALANSIKYRLKYPVDQHCAIRMGAILSFLEYEKDGEVFSEPADKCELFWINKKTELALDQPELYTFFLTWGLTNSANYNEALATLTDSEYFIKRTEAIRSLLPQD